MNKKMGGCGCEACVNSPSGRVHSPRTGCASQSVWTASLAQRDLARGSKASPPRGKPLGLPKSLGRWCLIHGGAKMSGKKREQRGGRSETGRMGGSPWCGPWAELASQLGSAPGCALSGTTSSISGAAERVKEDDACEGRCSAHTGFSKPQPAWHERVRQAVGARVCLWICV